MTSGTSYTPPPAFGRFKLLHQIGAGVLGPVFRTHDQDRDRLVAVKAIALDLTPEQASGLAAEFQRIVDLEIDHPCIAAPLATGVEDFVAYLATPYVAGESLDAAIRQYGPAPAGDAIRLVAHVAEALDAAAQVGVFHGSLHPRDIIVTPGETHITGLGVAQALERVGLHGPVRRPYVSPERESGDEWGAAADIYSLAAIAYEVLTGRRALPGTDQPLPALNDLRVHDAAALRDLIEAALDTDPERRPAHAREFAQALAAALSEAAGPPAATERGSGHRPRKPRTRPSKLPGIDEPLLPADAPAAPGKAKSSTPPRGLASLAPLSARARVVTPAAAAKASVRQDQPTGEAPAAKSQPVPAAAAPDDGAVAPAREVGDSPASAPPPEEETIIRFPLSAGTLTPEVIPDIHLPAEPGMQADEANARADGDLADALDRLSQDGGGNPPSAEIGIDIAGPEPASRPGDEEAASPDISFGPAGEAHAAFELPADLGESLLPDANAGTSAAANGDGDLVLDLENEDRHTQGPSARDEGVIDLGTFDLSFPLDDNQPGATVEVPDSGAGERRTPLRLTPADRVAMEARPAPGQAAEMPRAFEETKGTPSGRPVPGFEFLGGERPSGFPLFPVVIGVAAGLLVGLAGGYWLGSRSAVPESAAPQAASAPKAAAQARAGAGAPGRSATAPPATSPAGAVSPGLAAAPAVSPTAPSAPRQAAADGASGTSPVRPPAAAPIRPSPAPPPAVSEHAPEPAKPAANLRGSIAVAAKPGSANVYLDGERSGLTPRNLRKVPLGSHTIRVTRPGYGPQEQTVVLTAENPSARLAFTLKPARASEVESPEPKAAAGVVEAKPAAGGPQPKPGVKSVLTVLVESVPAGARISIDGRSLGVTPLMVRQLRPGTHKIELRLTGYRPWSSSLTVAAGDHQRLSAPLERDITR